MSKSEGKHEKTNQNSGQKKEDARSSYQFL
jgi:hypothetical protein